jgi:hypothetical protein
MCDVLNNVDVLARVPMHVVYLVPEIQMKRKGQYGNTQQVQHGTTRTIINNKHQNFHRKHGFYRKTEIWVFIVLARSLPARWLGVYQPAAVLARNLPTRGPISLEGNY